MKPQATSHHVVPYKDGWAVRKSGSDRVSQTFDRQRDAIDRGRDISRNQHTELIIHDRSGLINRRDSHGNDPFPPKG
jgi:uncharacterized protein YdaT